MLENMDSLAERTYELEQFANYLSSELGYKHDKQKESNISLMSWFSASYSNTIPVTTSFAGKKLMFVEKFNALLDYLGVAYKEENVKKFIKSHGKEEYENQGADSKTKE